MARVLFALMFSCAAVPALAADVRVSVVDGDGKPVAGAVIELAPDTAVQLPASEIPAEAIIDQRHETFVPLVSRVRKGGYSFGGAPATSENGYAFTGAVSWLPKDWVKLTGEILSLQSECEGRTVAALAPQQTETLFQLSARFYLD